MNCEARHHLGIVWVSVGRCSFVTWVGLCLHWRTEHHRFTKVSANLLATAAPLLACASFAYVQFVRPIARSEYAAESWGVLLSLSGIVLGFITGRSPTWYSRLAFAISAWMFLLFFLAACTG